LWCGIQGNVNPLMQLPTVLPGTELHRRYLGQLVRSVDTYFALGLEFTPQGRLPDDEALIESDPEIFSSFWNLPCSGVPLAELHRLASDFPLVVTFFPKTFLLLTRALRLAPSALFQDFATALLESAGEVPLDAPRCYRFFPQFAAARLQMLPATGDWAHLAEVLAYEMRALDVAQFAKGKKTGNIDLQHLHEWRPQRPANVRVSEFRFDLSAIVADLKAGIVRVRYPEQASCLVFRQQGSELQVSTVNAFGAEFLAQCDGKTSLAEIAARLQPGHGAGQRPEEFFAACCEAAQQLASLELLEMTVEQQPEEGR
jgi:hypothetical protein